MIRNTLFFLSILLVFVTGCENIDREEVMEEVPSTSLINENISGLKLGMVITDNTFIEEHGEFYAHPHNDTDHPYNLLWNGNILIRVAKETNEIITIFLEEKNKESATAKGVKIGTSIESVVELYESDYYTYQDRGQGLNEIGYVDHIHNISLSFVHFDGKVTNISLSNRY